MLYIDTSLLIALHIEEVHSEAAWSWFETRADSDFLYSEWTDLEFASALSRKVRAGRLSPSQRQEVEATFAATKADSFRLVPIGTEHFRLAEFMVKLHETGLRSGDALHLAIANDYGATLATLDDIMTLAAARFGVPVERPI